MIGLLAVVAIGLAAVMSAAWVVQRMTGNTSWVDAFWTFGTGAAGVTFALWPLDGAGANSRQEAVAVLVAAWALRLGSHIAIRASAGRDDSRYADLRRQWGDAFEVKLFGFLMMQALVAWGLALSMLLAARNPVPEFRLQDWLAAAVLVVSIVGEAVADRQLRRFMANPANKGRICDVGLWSWSRHPNYFFEWLGWVAYPLFAISTAWWWGWLALSGAAVMFWTLRFASGVPPLEAHMQRRHPEAFRNYQARVNTFFPAPPRLSGDAR